MDDPSLPVQSKKLTRQRILVVDDEPGITFLVQTQLENNGFEVLTAGNGIEALNVIKQHGLPHLAIVDIMMPEMNGFEFCEAVQKFSDFPIIMLTSIGDEETVVQAIDSYADDYITKPFRPRELLARVRRVIRRSGDLSYSFDLITEVDQRLSVDIANQRVIVDGQSLDMTPTESKLLQILMSKAGEILSSEFLQQRLWPQGAVVEGALRINIFRLRQKIEPDSKNPQYLITHRGVGYSFQIDG